MVIFLSLSAVILFVAGSLLLLSPATIKRITDVTSKMLFEMDDKMLAVRRPLGVLFLAATIVLCYILLYRII